MKVWEWTGQVWKEKQNQPSVIYILQQQNAQLAQEIAKNKLKHHESMQQLQEQIAQLALQIAAKGGR
ncbi:hypothetical protein CN326_14000 [Bacillus sp. AFS018417]|uniref:hypothetical protein n=1 Tax=Bacillus sp. AFS018417 TaxID=2033491 RepID=UPI000BF57847|nr:hypothetical protein [Bacillus sp. AFS018417]PEZ05571.1 hypothetical protein CN326_14000 [Bacillus sp. AFS018417]